MVKRQRAGQNRVLYLSLAAVALAGAFLIYRSAAKPARATTITDVPANNLQAEGYLKGNADAPVQIIEFADFECPACAQFATITEPDVRSRLIETGIANLRFFDYPLAQHRNSLVAHNAAACAAEQGKFWEMHDQLFAGQVDWSMGSTSNPKRIFSRYASEIGLDGNRWEECYDSRRHEARIRANAQEGDRRQIQSTPTFVVGRRMAPGAISYDELKRLVDSARVDAQRSAPATAAPSGAKAPADTAKRP